MTAAGIATVARQELRLRIRAGRWKWLLGAFFVVLVVFTALLSAGLAGVGVEQIPYRGTVLFGSLMLFVLGLALLVVPALAAQSVNGDRERGTLATLQVTRLSAAEITLGKFAAAWGTSLVFLVLTLPLVVFAMTQSGVPFARVVVVLAVMALLLGTVCAVSLWLSAVLARTTTSAVRAYLAVFTLTVGTLIAFGLATAVTTESYTATYEAPCPVDDTSCIPGSGRESYESTRERTDRTWWLLAPNPFVVLADAAPALPTQDPDRNRLGVQASDFDPLGQIGRVVRELRLPPREDPGWVAVGPDGDPNSVRVYPEGDPGSVPLRPGDPSAAPAVWPTGLAVNVLLGVGALVLTVRRLRTPTRTLPTGQRVA